MPQVGKPREKRLLAATGMMEPLHGEQLPLDGVMGLIQHSARHGHLRVFEDRIPARLLLLEPAPDALAVGWPSRGGDVVGKVAQSLTQRKYPQALALSYPVEQGVELRTERLTHWRSNRRQFLWELEECVAQAVAEARPGKQRPQALAGAVEAIRQDAPDAIGRVLLGGSALKLAIRLGKRHCTGVLRITEMPQDTATDNRGQIDLLGETVAVLLVGQEIRGQCQPTPGHHRHQAVVAQRAHETVEGHGRE